ncbi:MAG: hypothetical protein Q4G64_00805, partial [bacterium]|nr:hypothetical protein [bacterium]
MESERKPLAAIFDMDGTLVDVTSVRHYVTGRPRNFDRFHRASAFCPPHRWVVDMARELHEGGVVVLVVTGRAAQYRQLSEDWLAKWEVPYSRLETRGFRDNRADFVVKEEILLRLMAEYEIAMAVDDNPDVISLWQRYEIPVVEVPGWDHG